MRHAYLAIGGVAALAGAPAAAQSLYLQPVEQRIRADGTVDEVASLRRASLLFVAPPEPRVFQPHDLITIVIDENTSATSSQTLETEKEYETQARIRALLDLHQLLETRLIPGDTNLTLVDAEAEREFAGEGEYEREDRFSARLTAEVLEIKPNGTMLIQATKRIEKDNEIQTLVVSGLARQEDITRQNTVLSSQLSSLNVILKNEGDIRDAADKGLITRILDAVFAF